jgi:hypothetical protein
VAIGLTLVYFVMSLFASTINEGISAAFGWRARFLEKWLARVLSDVDDPTARRTAVKEFLAHPLIDAAAKPPRAWRLNTSSDRGPAYIATEVFSAAVLTPRPAAPDAPSALADAIDALPSEYLKKVARALCTEAVKDVEQLRAELERWYDNSMERVSGWYKRRVQLMLAVIGLALAIAVNADTLQIVQSLWSDKTVRAAVVAEAGRTTSSGQPPADLKNIANQVKQIKALDIPLGWRLTRGDPRDLPHSLRGWLGKVLGLLLTAIALSLGAPFWFDLLSRVARIRFSGPPPPPRDGTRTGEGDPTRRGPTSMTSKGVEVKLG